MYRKDQVMNMAKAKIVKRKRRLRIEGLATLLLTLSIFGYFGAKFALKSYNITLQLKAQAVSYTHLDTASTLFTIFPICWLKRV